MEAFFLSGFLSLMGAFYTMWGFLLLRGASFPYGGGEGFHLACLPPPPPLYNAFVFCVLRLYFALCFAQIVASIICVHCYALQVHTCIGMRVCHGGVCVGGGCVRVLQISMFGFGKLWRNISSSTFGRVLKVVVQ